MFNFNGRTFDLLIIKTVKLDVSINLAQKVFSNLNLTHNLNPKGNFVHEGFPFYRNIYDEIIYFDTSSRVYEIQDLHWDYLDELLRVAGYKYTMEQYLFTNNVRVDYTFLGIHYLFKIESSSS